MLGRGLQGDRGALIAHLQAVSYYRLSGYFHPFRKPDPADNKLRLNEFSADATVATVWNRYVFDRRLRLLVMDALERIEVDVRTRLTYLHTEQYGPFGYADNPASLPKMIDGKHDDFLNQLGVVCKKSREDFVEHFRKKYGDDHNDLPLWVACELITFGNVFTFYRGCETRIQKQIAKRYGVHDAVCDSWLNALNTI